MIMDPDYARAFSIIRCIAWSHGYAAALHGSCTRDLDVVLVAWTDIAEENHEKIVKQVASSTNTKISGSFSGKPHGRKAYTLLFKEFGDPRWIDLSIIPPRKYHD